MKLDLKFKENAQRLDLGFGQYQDLTDGGYERGYAAGYKDGEVKTEKVVNSVLDRTITEWETDEYIYSLDTGVLRYCSKLVRIRIDSVVSIGSGALADCTALPSVRFPNCKSITSTSFENDTSLAVADFSALANLGGVRAFGSCVNLRTLIIRTPSVCTLGNINAFVNTPIANGTGYIYVPKALLEKYKAATNWSTYAAQLRAIEDFPLVVGGWFV